MNDSLPEVFVCDPDPKLALVGLDWMKEQQLDVFIAVSMNVLSLSIKGKLLWISNQINTSK